MTIGGEGLIRGIAMSAANRMAIMWRHGEEKREEGDRPNADKVWTRERDGKKRKETETEIATGRVCTNR